MKLSPKIIVISGPSGVGKNTIAKGLLDGRIPELEMVTRCTTRAPRPDEYSGGEYEFLSVPQFKAKIKNGELIEHNYYNHNYYGLPKAPIDQALANGQSPVVVLDVNGAQAVRYQYPKESLLIFITAPHDQIRTRLEKRGQNTPEEIKARIHIAKAELAESNSYDIIVENIEGKLETAVKTITNFITEREQ